MNNSEINLTQVDVDFPAFYCDDFLTKSECENLITAANKLNPESISSQSHGGRFSIFSSSEDMEQLITESSVWQQLKEFIEKDTLVDKLFMNFEKSSCLNGDIKIGARLKDINKKFSVRPTFPNFNPKKLRSKSRQEVRYSSNKVLAATILCRWLNFLFRHMLSLSYFFLGKRVIVPLWDYSMAKNGYGREVHRDSDSRVVVFLIYLNEIGVDADGGGLTLYNSFDSEKGIWPPRPSFNNVTPLETLKPKAGRLVIFLNTANAYHSVDTMQNSDRPRHFIYGGYTLLSSLGSIARRYSSSAMPTEFNIYD